MDRIREGRISRRGLLGLGVAGGAAALVPASTLIAAPVSAQAADQGGPPRGSRASDFLGSLGVGTHIGQGVDSAAQVGPALSYLGLGHLRDDGNPAHVQDWITVHQLSGARTNLLTNQNVSETIDMATQLRAAGALLSIEGPNEPNNFPVTYQGQTSGYTTTFLPVAHLQRDLYASSEAGGSEPDDVGLQFLTIPPGAATLLPPGTRYADYANTHTYPQGHTNLWRDNIGWNGADPTLNGDWDGLYVEYGTTWHESFPGYPVPQLPSLPRVMTETGWTTQGANSLTEDQQGRLIMAIYLSNFARGWTDTFIYMLRDDPIQGYWGLVDVDYQPKLSGQYVHNLTTILADSGSGQAGPPAVDYQIPYRSSTVHDLLLQKSSGELDLVLWSEQALGSANVVVEFTTPRGPFDVLDPTVGTGVAQTLPAGRSLQVTLSGYQVLVARL
jgi:hypothetical protein